MNVYGVRDQGLLGNEDEEVFEIYINYPRWESDSWIGKGEHLWCTGSVSLRCERIVYFKGLAVGLQH